MSNFVFSMPVDASTQIIKNALPSRRKTEQRQEHAGSCFRMGTIGYRTPESSCAIDWD